MVCENCGKSNAKVIREKQRLLGGKLIVENVPIVNCPDCKERIIEKKTLEKLGEISTRFEKEKMSFLHKLGLKSTVTDYSN